MQLGEDGSRLAITCVTRAQQQLNSNPGFNEQTDEEGSPPGPVCKFSCLVIDHLYQRCGGGQTGMRMTFSANK